MHIIQLALGLHHRSWRLFCLSTLLLAQPVAAERISLGNAYSTFGNLIIVGTSVNESQNCSNLRDAIANTSGIRTLKLPPATYNCSFNALDVPSGTTIEGSGQQNTRITGFSTVTLETGAVLNNLTVENLSSGQSRAIRALTMRAGSVANHVTAISQGVGNFSNEGIFISGASSSSLGVEINNVTARADNSTFSNFGMVVNASSLMVTLNDVNLLAPNTPGSASQSAGMLVFSRPPLIIRNSVLDGANNAIQHDGTFATYTIIHSQLVNGIANDGDLATFTCFGAYDENITALSTTCTPP